MLLHETNNVHGKVKKINLTTLTEVGGWAGARVRHVPINASKSRRFPPVWQIFAKTNPYNIHLRRKYK